jgi:excisionase family DNA binding protein
MPHYHDDRNEVDRMGALTMTEDRLLTVSQVAERMQANPETVRRWLRSGRLRGVLPGGDRLGWRIRESELQRFLASLPDGDDTESGEGF